MKRRAFLKGMFAVPSLAVPTVVKAEIERQVEEKPVVEVPIPTKLIQDEMVLAAMTPHAHRPGKNAILEPLDITDPELGKTKFPVLRDHEGWFMAELNDYARERGRGPATPCWWKNDFRRPGP